MANLENVSTEDLRQILAEVDDGATVQRLMAAITYKEIDDFYLKNQRNKDNEDPTASRSLKLWSHCQIATYERSKRSTSSNAIL